MRPKNENEREVMKNCLFFAMVFCAMPLTANAQETAAPATAAEAPTAATEAPAAEAAPAPEAKAESKPVAVFFLRQSVVPREGDEVHLKRGLSMMIASSRGGMTIVEYGLKDGQITWKATSGSVDKRTAKKIDKAVAKLQKRM